LILIRMKSLTIVVLFLRHKLQKGLCSRDNPARAEDMPSMNEHLIALENFADLEAQIIQKTKVAKLLKVILKLTSLPRDEEFKFKERCGKLLAGWNAILAADENGKEIESAPNGMNEDTKAEPSSEIPVPEAKEAKEPITNGSSKTEETVKRPTEESSRPEAVPELSGKTENNEHTAVETAA